MNISYLRSGEIDRAAWDDCVSSAANPLIYANSFYLDIVHPGWEGLVAGDYLAVFPLTFGRKFGVKCLLQPLFTQQLGMFQRPSADMKADEFLEKLPRPVPKLIRLNAHSRPELWRCSRRMNYTLRISTVAEMEKNFSENTRRNVRKAMDASVAVHNSASVSEFIDIKKSAGLAALKEEQWQRMGRLMHELQDRGLGELRSVTSNGAMQSAVFFATWKDRIYYLFSASTEAGRESRASFAIVYDLLKRHEISGMVLDFEGSMDDNVARFFKGFGALPEEYYEVKTIF